MARRLADDAPPPSPPVPGRSPLPAWFDPSLPPCNDDLSARVVLLADDADWRPTRHPDLEMRVLEHLGGNPPRLVAQLRLAPGTTEAAFGDDAGLELLVQRGAVETAEELWAAGAYVRLPADDAERLGRRVREADDATGTRATDTRPVDTGSDVPPGDRPGALLYVASGHMAAEDGERRYIDTGDASRWLPGPVEGTEVLPLHGHGSANVMLIRWLGPVAFRPRLDPLGEEVLVIEGCLHDAGGDYPSGSWIRNPVPAWQSWSGDAGTVVYYKNGHFAVPPDEHSAPDPSGD